MSHVLRATTMTELDYALNCAAAEIDTTNARAELAQLRAELAQLRAELAQLRADLATAHATVTAQAAQLEQARTLIEFGATMWCGSKNGKGTYNLRCQAWLAENPAPVKEPPTAMCDCNCGCTNEGTHDDGGGNFLCDACYADYMGIPPAGDEQAPALEMLDAWHERM